MRNPSRVLLCLGMSACLLTAFAGVAEQAHAISRAQANRVALKVLAPKKAKSDSVVVFGLPRALGPKTTVVEAVGNSSRPTTVVRNGRIGRRAWLFWEDLAYGAKFAHPSRLVLVDARSGKVIRNRKLRWWPLI